MKRTRKWSFVQQDAIRFAGLGLTPREIAKRLGVNKSTVTRWIASGKLGSARERQKKTLSLSKDAKTPQAWATAVRKDYALDSTDEQLVTLAKDALTMARDRKLQERVRLSAMDRYARLVKQLALVTRDEEGAPEKPAESTPAETPRPTPVQRADPRKVLMMTAAK